MSEEEKQMPEYLPVGPIVVAPVRKARIKIKPTENAPADEKARVVDGFLYGERKAEKKP